jgi:hypothetical protein
MTTSGPATAPEPSALAVGDAHVLLRAMFRQALTDDASGRKAAIGFLGMVRGRDWDIIPTMLGTLLALSGRLEEPDVQTDLSGYMNTFLAAFREAAAEIFNPSATGTVRDLLESGPPQDETGWWRALAKMELQAGMAEQHPNPGTRPKGHGWRRFLHR